MFRAIFYHELKNCLFSYKFAATVLVLLILFSFALTINTIDYNRRNHNYLNAAARARETLAEIYLPSSISPTLHWPPSKLSIFIKGEDNLHGNSVTISRWKVPDEAGEGLADNELLSSLPNFDVLTIFSIAMTLFGLLLGYDAISRDREEGHLKLILSNCIKRATIFTAKFLALSILLSLSIVICMLTGLLLLNTYFEISFSPAEFAAIAMITIFGILISILSVALGLLMSTLCKSSAQSLLVSLVIWMIISLILPTLAVDLSRAFVKLPSPNEISSAEQQTQAEVGKKTNEFRAEKTPYALRFMGDGYSAANVYIFDAPAEVWQQAKEYFVFYEKFNRSGQISYLTCGRSMNGCEAIRLRWLTIWDFSLHLITCDSV